MSISEFAHKGGQKDVWDEHGGTCTSFTLPSLLKWSYRSSSVTFGERPLTYKLYLVSLL